MPPVLHTACDEKGLILCTFLHRRCAVIAAANPIGGHYDRGKTVNENLKMPRAILSRFDVIFILLDDPDADRDRMLSVQLTSIIPSQTFFLPSSFCKANQLRVEDVHGYGSNAFLVLATVFRGLLACTECNPRNTIEVADIHSPDIFAGARHGFAQQQALAQHSYFTGPFFASHPWPLATPTGQIWKGIRRGLALALLQITTATGRDLCTLHGAKHILHDARQYTRDA
jgi:hypothetical protein